VSKQFSANAIEQTLAQTEGLTEVQLNSLLERLESQKALLPFDDHSIVDWGISTLKTRIHQKKKVMSQIEKDLESVWIEHENLLNSSQESTEAHDCFQCIKKALPHTVNVDDQYLHKERIIDKIRTNLRRKYMENAIISTIERDLIARINSYIEQARNCKNEDLEKICIYYKDCFSVELAV